MTDTPKAADFAKGWPRRVRDVEGLRVRLLRPASNGYVQIPAGAEGTLRQSTGWGALSFLGDPCSCCKMQPRMTRMSWRDFAPVPQ